VLKKVISGFFALAAGMTILVGVAPANPSDGLRTYQNAPALTEEHKQNIAEDISRFKQADNLWDVLRDEFSLPHYENNPLVQEKIEFFMNNQDFLMRSVNRAAPYLYYILQQVKKRHLPAELVLLPIVESGYNPFAISNVGATGIWQLMPLTATGLGVQQDWWFDGRRDVIASTRGALNYLAYLQSFFDGNWLLAIAAYNTGEGNVLAAIRRNIQDGRDTDFWSLPVATQTKNYVPSILALAVIISNPSQYPIYFPPVRNAPYLAQFDVQKKLTLKTAAALAGISYNRMVQLNPGFKRSATNSGYKLILPIENVEQFSENLMHSPYREPTIPSWKHYRMKAGDTLLSVAKKFKTTTDEIRKLNHLGKANLRRGTNLLIPNNDDKPSSLAMDEEVTPTKKPTIRGKKKDSTNVAMRLNQKLLEAEIGATKNYRLQPGDTIYMVRSTDTLEKIAQRFRISANTLKAANKIQGQSVTPGKQIIIPTHTPSATPSATHLAAVEDISSDANEKTYIVRRGDTIAKIAKRFNTSPASIRLANLIDDSNLLEGIKLTIPTTINS
jgi:membrane-bound lytic murein transglycosylase D